MQRYTELRTETQPVNENKDDRTMILLIMSKYCHRKINPKEDRYYLSPSSPRPPSPKKREMLAVYQYLSDLDFFLEGGSANQNTNKEKFSFDW